MLITLLKGIIMSLQDKKKLADLKSEAKEFYDKRHTVFTEMKEKAIEAVKNDFIVYLSEEGFTSSDNAYHQVVEASYKNDIFLFLKYSSANDNFIGANSIFEVGEQNAEGRPTGKKMTISMNMQQENIPHFSYMGTTEDKLANEILFYENTLLPKLRALGTSDITGKYELKVSDDKNRGKTAPQTVQEIINKLMH